MRIRHASEERLPDINSLVARSKAHWGWPPDYLAAALALMKITPAYVRENLCFEVLEGEAVVGFFALAPSPERRLLDHLWIEPERIGQGLGRFACDEMFDLARRKGWADLTTFPDPPAEGFYLRMGFSDTGERRRSGVPGGPVFSVFKITLDPGAN
ncbi:MAG: GNAT family N-acetyltransferase [Caulobacteraceae bacterium]